MQPEIYTISRLNHTVKFLLENEFSEIWVEGEISNWVSAASGHCYFSLKDQEAQVRCAIFRNSALKLKFTPQHGVHVVAKARVSLYTARGDYQLIIDSMELQGEGQLQQKFLALKLKLDKAGLFDVAHKKPIPALARCIGVVTSAQGAAIHDILTVLKRRFPAIPVIVYPSLVQGDMAAAAIAYAIECANRHAMCDVLIVGRGGGSLEDLWPFNEEKVAYAIFNSRIPIISAVGHEVDVTIADLVADLRAPTPSAAAELVSPDREQWLARLTQYFTKLTRWIQHAFELKQQQVLWLSKRLQHPGKRLEYYAQRLDELFARLFQAQRQFLKHFQAELLRHSQTLHAVSPLATLARGYAIVETDSGVIVRRADELMVGETLTTRLAEGKVRSIVSSIEV